jgi:hypothetical protein
MQQQTRTSLRGVDELRASTGIRPSLHPITINALVQVLQLRAKQIAPLQVEPIEVALAAGKVAAEAIAKRRETSCQDGMRLLPKEEHTIAGRVIGVAMRLAQLETMLHEKCLNATWVPKYDEWDSFGTLQDEPNQRNVDQRVYNDPLFGLNRAECLLALYLHSVEEPELKLQGVDVPGGSNVDFLDTDKRNVLLKREQTDP